MKKEVKKNLCVGISSLVLFMIWTILLQIVDVQAIGPNQTKVGLATLNAYIHAFTGVHMNLYTMSDYLGLIPIFICMYFACVGCYQLLKRKSIFKVDLDLIVLGVYYSIVILCFIFFEKYPINYRPVLIEGRLEASYPSSTTLLVLSVMPTCILYVKQKIKNNIIKNIVCTICILFMLFMVIGRCISGVHWFTDIVASVMLCTGLYNIYKSIILYIDRKE